MKRNDFIIVLLVTLNLFNISCDSSDNSPVDVPNGTSVNFEKALLESFPLSEVDNDLVNIAIEQPKMIDGSPQNKGKITIVLAYTETSKFSLKQVSFNTSDFSILPKIGVKSILAGESITYTITSNKDASVSMQYDVLVKVKPIDPANEKLAINAFRFLKANNSNFSDDISSTEIRKYINDNRHDAIIIMTVPNQTNFSNLAPTIDFEGSFITYRTTTNGNNSDFKEFNNGTALDFKYPNIINFRVHNSDKSKFYESYVYVDIKDPIVFDKSSVIINDGAVVSYINSYDNVIGFTNQGNYPVRSHNYIKASKIEVTESVEATPVNYYSNISLRSDKELLTGEKGRLYVQTSFPGNFNGTGSSSGVKTYTIKAEFKTMLNHGGIITFNANSAINNTDFYVYNPAEIEVKANVYVTKM